VREEGIPMRTPFELSNGGRDSGAVFVSHHVPNGLLRSVGAGE